MKSPFSCSISYNSEEHLKSSSERELQSCRKIKGLWVLILQKSFWGDFPAGLRWECIWSSLQEQKLLKAGKPHKQKPAEIVLKTGYLCVWVWLNAVTSLHQHSPFGSVFCVWNTQDPARGRRLWSLQSIKKSGLRRYLHTISGTAVK